MQLIDDLAQLTEMVQASTGLYLRYSLGPDEDTARPSRDYEADVELPGLPCTLLNPESWWPRETVDWVARRVCKYVHLAAGDARRRAWVLTGRVAGYGPDHEPLLADIEPIAWLGEALIAQARQHYEQHFDVGRTSL